MAPVFDSMRTDVLVETWKQSRCFPLSKEQVVTDPIEWIQGNGHIRRYKHANVKGFYNATHTND